LWWLDDRTRILEESQSAIHSQDNNVFVSAAIAWEILIIKALGKLHAPDNLDEVIRDCRFSPLPITVGQTDVRM
jgi:PIN domain nuclease of toxin-antitoxin system